MKQARLRDVCSDPTFTEEITKITEAIWIHEPGQRITSHLPGRLILNMIKGFVEHINVRSLVSLCIWGKIRGKWEWKHGLWQMMIEFQQMRGGKVELCSNQRPYFLIFSIKEHNRTGQIRLRGKTVLGQEERSYLPSLHDWKMHMWTQKLPFFRNHRERGARQRRRGEVWSRNLVEKNPGLLPTRNQKQDFPQSIPEGLIKMTKLGMAP